MQERGENNLRGGQNVYGFAITILWFQEVLANRYSSVENLHVALLLHRRHVSTIGLWPGMTWSVGRVCLARVS